MPIPQESFTNEGAAMTSEDAESPATTPSPEDAAPEALVSKPPVSKPLAPAAQRALAEAEARREALDAKTAELARQREINGRGGLDPARYDDWEVKGLASDF